MVLYIENGRVVIWPLGWVRFISSSFRATIQKYLIDTDFRMQLNKCSCLVPLGVPQYFWLTCSATLASTNHQQALTEVPVLLLIKNSHRPGAAKEQEQLFRLSCGCGGPCVDRKTDNNLSRTVKYTMQLMGRGSLQSMC